MPIGDRGKRRSISWLNASHDQPICSSRLYSSVTPDRRPVQSHDNLRTLLLIRHGQIKANVRGRWHGATDSPLTRQGRRQAVRVAHRMRDHWSDLAAIYSSPMQRCLHTAQTIGQAFGMAVNIDDDLREYGIGELEDTSFAVLQNEHAFFQRIRQDQNFAPPGGDSVGSVARRIVPALRRIHATDAPPRPVAVIGHGAALAIALASLLDADASHWTNYQFDNCSVTELLLEPEPLIAMFNNTEHL